MAFSVSGLTTGLDVTSMVSQLMQVERLQGNPLIKGKQTSQSFVSAMTTLNNQMKSLGDAAKAFAPTSVLDKSVFSAVTAKSSDESVAKVTAGENASAGALTFTVKSIAQAGSVVSGSEYAADALVSDPDGTGTADAFEFTLEVNGKAQNVQVGPNAKLADVVQAINQQAGTDVKASMMQVASGTYKLQIQSLSTGEQSNINITDGATPPMASDVLGSFTRLTEGRDTVLQIGDAAAGVEVRSSTREVKDVLPGLTINPVAVSDKPVTVDMSSDVDGMAEKLAAMVKAANDAMATVGNNSKWDADKKAGGPFLGDSTARGVVNELRSAFTGSSSYLPGMAGVELQKDGTIKFDKAKFTAAYAENAAEVTKNVTALASKLGEVSKNASNSTDGTLTIRLQGEQAQLKDYDASLAKFEERMTAKQALYKQQFSALDSMLSKMQAQGNWLTGQLASLGQQ